MKLYIEGTDEGNEPEEQEGMLPPLQEQESVASKEIIPNQHFTQPPPRYTEASLVKILEEYGIGRPSTYASIMNTLVTRKYVRLEKRAFHAEDVGMVVNDLLANHFTKYVDYDFTANFEEELDAVSRGEKQWKPLLKEYWEPFVALLKQKGTGDLQGRSDHGKNRQDLPGMRQRAGHQAGTLRQVSRLQRLSRLPPHRTSRRR